MKEEMVRRVAEISGDNMPGNFDLAVTRECVSFICQQIIGVSKHMKRV